MQLSPRYDDAPAIDIRVDPAVIRDPFLTQRRRLVAMVEALTDEQMRQPSRCEGWSVANVLTHLIDVDRFWAASGSSGVAGTPTRFLEHFDPEATPRTLVAGWGEVDPAEVRAQLATATSALCDAVEALGDDAWHAIAESPPGHVTVVTMLAHALWDAWIHERDIGLPLGLDLVEDDAEVAAVLAYAAGLSPALAVVADDTRTGRLAVVATDPEVSFVVDVVDRTATVSMDEAPAGVTTLSGRGIDLAEALSQRGGLNHDLGLDQRWMVEGLAEVFRPAPQP